MLLGMFTIEVDIGDAAAWVQGLGSLLAVIAAIAIAVWGHFRQDRIEKEARHRAHLANTEKIAHIESVGVVILDALRIEEGAEEISLPVERLRTVQSQLNRVCDIVDHLILQESSDVSGAYNATLYILGVSQISRLIDMLCDNPKGNDSAASGKVFFNNKSLKDLRIYMTTMKEAKDATKKYVKTLSQESSANHNDI